MAGAGNRFETIDASMFTSWINVIHKHACGKPVTIVFSDHNYSELLKNWLAYACRSDAPNIVVIAVGRGVTDAIKHWPVLSIEIPAVRSTSEFWHIRVKFFAALAAYGVDFIHSDADAIWIQHAFPNLFQPGTDITFTQGTVWPIDVLKKWDLVLCCGLFAVRASAKTANFFSSVELQMETIQDDQCAINRELASMDLNWFKPQTNTIVNFKGTQFRIYDETVQGTARDITVSLLPHRLFPRLAEENAEAVIAHPLTPKNSDDKIKTLRRLKLWHSDLA